VTIGRTRDIARARARVRIREEEGGREREKKRERESATLRFGRHADDRARYRSTLHHVRHAFEAQSFESGREPAGARRDGERRACAPAALRVTFT
jgi:hypothetical protein